MALNFPDSPVDGQQFTSNNITWMYSSSLTAWRSTDTRIVTVGSSLNNQILYNSGNTITGSNGMTYSSSANTVFANTMNLSQSLTILSMNVVPTVAASFDSANAALAAAVALAIALG